MAKAKKAAKAAKTPKPRKAAKGKKVKRHGKRHPVVGVDVGAKSVKICHVVDHGGKLLLKALDAMDVDFQEGASSAEKQLAKVQALRTLLDRNKIKTKRCSVAVSGQAVAIRRIEMPMIADDRLGQIVRYDAEQQIPFPLNDVIWDYFKQDPKEGEMLHVVLVAARKDMVREVTRVVMEAGLEPEIVTVNSLASYSACKVAAEEEDAVAYVDVGARTTDVTIEVKGDLCFSRSIHFAMDRVTEEMQKALDIENAQAEKVKRRLVAEEGTQEEREALLAGIRRIVGEVQRTLNFFRTETGGLAAQRMVCSGGGLLHQELVEIMGERLGIPVQEGNPFERLELPKSLQGRIPHPGAAGTVVGLGMAGAGTRATFENLMPDEVKAKKQIRFRMKYVAACVLVTGFNFMALGVLKNTSIRNTNYNVSQVKENMAQLQERYDRVEELDATVGALREKMGLMGAMNVDRGKVTDMVVEISRLVTPDIQLLSLNSDPGTPNRYLITGLSGSTDSLSSLLNRMENSPIFADVAREGELVFTDRNEYTKGPSAMSSRSADLPEDVRKRLEERGVDPNRAGRPRGRSSRLDLEPRPAFKFTIAFGLKLQ